jgi:predicted RNase H-like nuclease
VWHVGPVAVVGIDGCKSGWIAVVLAEDQPPRAHHLPHIDAVSTVVPDAQVIAIDIPIGLPEAGRREADIAAKRFLGARQSSVFLTPVRAAVEALTHAEATAASTRETGMGISRQSYALAQKILEVDRWVPSAPCPVFEVHPEVSFAVLLGAPARASKKTWAGMVERQEGLAAAGIHLNGVDGAAAVAAAVDDMLDAAVAAWTARRLADGTARQFPHASPSGGRQSGAVIWA